MPRIAWKLKPDDEAEPLVSPTPTPNHLTPEPAGLLYQLGIAHQAHAPLGPRTWYAVGGEAEVLAQPSSLDQLQAVVAACHQCALPLRVLGKGANLLVRDHQTPAVPGVVLALKAPFFTEIQDHGGQVQARGGVDLFKLVRQTARAGLSGLDSVAGIPATVGGAIRMNAGGAFGEIGDCVQSVTVMRENGELQTLQRQQITFGYRQTDIEAPLIVEATFALTPAEPEQTTGRMKEIFAYKKQSQPMGDQSAGCAFKNPKDQTDKGAGQLIDEAGLKGYTRGSAQVSTVHANFITVDKQAGRAEDVYQLMQHVQQVVYDHHRITLQREVVVWP
jgi:UDP-N-acetylmuramate dehydrogenase